MAQLKTIKQKLIKKTTITTKTNSKSTRKIQNTPKKIMKLLRINEKNDFISIFKTQTCTVVGQTPVVSSPADTG